MKKLVITAAALLFAVNVQAGQPLDQTIPCEHGGHIVLTGNYEVSNGELTAHLQAVDCVTEDYKGDYPTINGNIDVSGTLPMSPESEVDLTITVNDVSTTVNYSAGDRVRGADTEHCSGTMNLKGPISATGQVDLTRSSNITCKGNGWQHGSKDDFINDLIYFRVMH